MPRKNTEDRQRLLSALVISRESATNQLETQIKSGYQIRERSYSTHDEIKAGQSEREQWEKYTVEVLRRCFSTDEYAKEFFSAGPQIRFTSLGRGGPTVQEHMKRLIDELDYKIKALESIFERLPLIPEVSGESMSPGRSVAIECASRKIFVVHGHDEEAKLSVARFLDTLNLEPVILHEQPNQGRTIIEKFEAYDEVGFAIVLFTPDDVGAPKEDQTKLNPRARQNVVFELGYFIGKMGRSRVCVLHKESVEVLSDYQGVLNIAMDKRGAWKMELGRELKHAGIKIDFDKVV